MTVFPFILDLLYAYLYHPRRVFEWFLLLLFGGFGSENKGNLERFVVLSLYECNNPGLTSYESNRVKIGSPV